MCEVAFACFLYHKLEKQTNICLNEKLTAI